MRRKYTLVIALLISVGVFVIAHGVEAATLYFTGGGTYSVGQTIPITVYVSTSQAMNGVSGTVSYPSDKLQLISMSKAGSILTFWTQEPSFSNANGQANFEGIAYNPGYTGPAGDIVTLMFKARATGDATISYSTASVLANDGQGTNILDSTKPLTISIGEGAPQPPTPTTPSSKPEKAPLAPQLSEIQDLTEGDRLEIQGITSPSVEVDISLLDDQARTQTQTTVSEGDGSFKLAWKGKLTQGSYSVTAQAVAKGGTKSKVSNKVLFKVNPRIYHSTTEYIVVNYGPLLLNLIILVLVLVILAAILLYRRQKIKNRISRKIQIADRALHAQFDDLKDEMVEEVRHLEPVETQKQLIAEEDTIIRSLNKKMKETQAEIENQIDDIKNI